MMIVDTSPGASSGMISVKMVTVAVDETGPFIQCVFETGDIQVIRVEKGRGIFIVD